MQQVRSPELQKELLKTVKVQIQNNDPPETKATFERLIAEGHSEQESYGLIVEVLADEITKVLRDKLPYNHDRYVNNLINLPKLPEE